MKKLSIIIIIFMCSILLTACAESCNEACYDEDWVPYENYTDDLNISIESNIFLMKECYPELLKICKKYEKKHAKDMKITYAEYNLYSEDEDYVMFVLATNYDVYTVECNIYVNTENNKAYKIEYEKGASKRVATHSVELEKTLDIDAKDLYNTIVARELSDKSKDIKEAILVFHGDEINVSIYDKECIYKDTIKYEN